MSEFKQLNGKDLAEIICFSLNSFGFNSKAFVETMLREHRTLQQSFVREIIMPYLKALSETTYCDDRNEASVNLAVVIMQRTTEDERCLPFI